MIGHHFKSSQFYIADLALRGTPEWRDVAVCVVDNKPLLKVGDIGGLITLDEEAFYSATNALLPAAENNKRTNIVTLSPAELNMENDSQSEFDEAEQYEDNSDVDRHGMDGGEGIDANPTKYYIRKAFELGVINEHSSHDDQIMYAGLIQADLSEERILDIAKAHSENREFLS